MVIITFFFSGSAIHEFMNSYHINWKRKNRLPAKSRNTNYIFVFMCFNSFGQILNVFTINIVSLFLVNSQFWEALERQRINENEPMKQMAEVNFYINHKPSISKYGMKKTFFIFGFSVLCVCVCCSCEINFESSAPYYVYRPVFICKICIYNFRSIAFFYFS